MRTNEVTRLAGIWHSVFRFCVGAYWLYFAAGKWAGVDWVRPLMQEAPKVNPIPGVRDLLAAVVAPHWELFAVAQTIGETTVAVLLIAGLATRVAGIAATLLGLGLVLSISFEVRDSGFQWMYILGALVSAEVAIAGPGSLALDRLRLVPRWLVGAAAALGPLAGCAPAAPPRADPGTVFLIVMENHSPAEALQGAFTASLANHYGEALDYHAVGHPSVPNYLALESGSTWGVTDWRYHALPAADLGAELTREHVSWRAYMEGLGPAGCISTPLPYDPGHNPFAFFGGGCPPQVVPLSSMPADLHAASPPRFVWISPDRCHDEHDCSVATGDAWLRSTVGEITSSPAWQPKSTLFITWDEDDGSADNSVLTLAVRPGGRHRVSSTRYDHFSLLATIEDLLRVPRLARSAQAQPMKDLL